MKRIETIIIKILIIQGIFLLLSQVFLHHYNLIPELNPLIQYEGVYKEQTPKIFEVFRIP